MTTPIEVRTRLDRDGKVIPLSCNLQGKRYQIMGVGRRWQSGEGEHLMVMFPGDRAVELLHHSDGSWQFVKDHSNLGDRLA